MLLPENLIKSVLSKFDSPLLIASLPEISDNFYALHDALPNVQLHYALKPLNHPRVIHHLNYIGASFDVATTGEINILKKLNISAEKVIHTHPIKRDKDIKAAMRFGITTFVIDNIDELLKFKKYKKKVKLLLRIAVKNSNAAIDLSKKFGCDSDNEALHILEMASKNGIHITGISFHVGSQCKDPEMYVKTIKICNYLFGISILKGYPIMNILDIGGGFPVDGEINILEFCTPV